MLSGMVGAALLGSTRTEASDLLVKAPVSPYELPAVDGPNGKVDAFGGVINSDTVYGVGGSFSAPLSNRQWGLQVDAAVGSLDQRAFGTLAPHFFWRDPRRALFGFYGSFTNWDQFDGVYLAQVAGEGEYYVGRFTLQGVLGVEFGNTVTSITPPMSGGGPGTSAGHINGAFDGHTRFFDQINLKYYFQDNWSAYVGHRYLGEKNALALGTETAMPLGNGMMGSLFVEGRIGEDNYNGIWGGVRLYFGNHDKTLIRRQREDDPNTWDTLHSLLNASGGSSTPFCIPPRTLQKNGRCEAGNP
jgi:hypothetical protein